MRALAHACCSAQPCHWLGPVTWSGWLGLAQPMWAELGPAQKIYVGPGPAKKIKNKMCMHK